MIDSASQSWFLVLLIIFKRYTSGLGMYMTLFSNWMLGRIPWGRSCAFDTFGGVPRPVIGEARNGEHVLAQCWGVGMLFLACIHPFRSHGVRMLG